MFTKVEAGEAEVLITWLCLQRWKQGKRKAESDEYRGGKFFCLVETPAAPLEQRQV